MAFSVADLLLKGEVLDRTKLAEFLEIQPAAAWGYVQAAVENIEAAKLVKPGRSQAVRLLGIRHGAPTMEVVVAACFAASLSSLFEGSAYQSKIREALDYVLDASPRPERFADFRRKFFFVRRGGEPGLSAKRKMLDGIVKAVIDSRGIDVEYLHFNEKISKIALRPLSLVIYDHQLYLLGRSDEEDGERDWLLRFSRIREVSKRQGRKFSYPAEHEFSPERLFEHSFGVFTSGDPELLEVRLHRRWASYAKSHHWHRSQEVHVDSRGVTLTMRVGICPEVEAWVLGFADEAEVIRPEHLRKMVAKRLRAAARRYDRGK
ncbi:MAG: WYL domain-containing protein [Myxococcales bacterium]|nr:WYL domain-containing protein [Myxococcales bacterium]